MRILLPVAVALLLSACRDPGLDAVRAADALSAAGRWEEAATAYVSLPAESGDWRAYGAWRAAAIQRDSLGDPIQAEAAFRECVSSWAEHEWGYTCQVELGDLARDQGRPRLAIDAYRKALELRPRGSYAEHCLLESGRAYMMLGEPAQARVEWAELTRGFRKSPHRPTIALEVARSYDFEGLEVDAVEAFRGVQKDFAQHHVAALAVFGEGEALEQLGRLDEAKAAFERALAVHPNPKAVNIKLQRLELRATRREQNTTVVPDSGRRRR